MSVPGLRRLPRKGAERPLDGDGAARAATGGLDRRSFLVRSGTAAALLGLAASTPGGTAIISGIESDAPAVGDGAATVTDVGVPAMTDPVVAHVIDVTSGEISIYSGSQEVVLRNPGLAAQLVRASH